MMNIESPWKPSTKNLTPQRKVFQTPRQKEAGLNELKEKQKISINNWGFIYSPLGAIPFP